MLEQMVESKSSAAETRRRFGFLTTTLFAVGLIFLTALTYSLFAKELGEQNDVAELSSLVAPVPVTDERPPQPEVSPQMTARPARANQSNEILRRNMFESLAAPTRPPAEIGGQKEVQSWVKGAKLAEIDFTPPNSNPAPRENTGAGPGISSGNTEKEETVEPPPAPKPKAEAKPEPKEDKKPPVMITGGVVNGKATSLVKPAYPPPAKAVRAAGAVNVQVVIDEKGNVISAAAVSGHQLLRQSAEQAARASKFTPTTLSNIPVKVTGVIIYNFVAQ